jgi:hypothetical protein
MKINNGYEVREHRRRKKAYDPDSLDTGDYIAPEGEKINFCPEHKYESWASVHDNQELNEDQARTLMNNIADKLDELQGKTLYRYTGKTVKELGDKRIGKHLRIIRILDPDDKSKRLSYLVWKNKPLAVWTSPRSSMRKRGKQLRYVLTWYYGEMI